MFGTLGGPEVVLILVIALIVFGPRKLPEIGKSVGRMMAEFRKASNDFKRTIEDELEAEKSRPITTVTTLPAPEAPGSEAAPPAADAPPATVSEPGVLDGSIEAAREPTAAPATPVPGAPESEARPEPATGVVSDPDVAEPAEPTVSRGGSVDKL